LEENIKKIDDKKFKEDVGNVFKKKFGNSGKGKALVYKLIGTKSEFDSMAISNFGIHLMNNIKLEDSFKTKDDLLTALIKDDLNRKNIGKQQIMNMSSKINTFFSASKNASFYNLISYLTPATSEGFVGYLKEQENKTVLDTKGEPEKNPKNYSDKDIENSLEFLNLSIKYKDEKVINSVASKIDNAVTDLITKGNIFRGAPGATVDIY
jgi:hypothetical protein